MAAIYPVYGDMMQSALVQGGDMHGAAMATRRTRAMDEMTIRPARPMGWGRVARTFHWGMAMAILVEVPAGFLMGYTYMVRDPAGMMVHLRSSQLHHTLGMALLLAAVLRMLWRVTHAAPRPAAAGRGERLLAGAVQGLLYLLLLTIPLSGWAALSALGAGNGYPAAQLWVFGQDGFGPGGFVPHLVPPVAWNAPVLFSYSLFAKIHRWALVVGGVALDCMCWPRSNITSWRVTMCWSACGKGPGDPARMAGLLTVLP